MTTYVEVLCGIVTRAAAVSEVHFIECGQGGMGFRMFY